MERFEQFKIQFVHAVTKEIIYNKKLVAILFEEFSVPYCQPKRPYMVMATFSKMSPAAIATAIEDPRSHRIPFKIVLPLEFNYLLK